MSSIYYGNIIKEEDHMIISRVIEKAFDKSQQPLLVITTDVY